ncbi:Sodium-dependent phosphate transporter 2 [Dissostichus eleginoides]|uniref:Sodium-dependent phosphate transporter 2 n=1 Tax=Dissostichus eleginoides TaxID=100907 RepID=A0AAD9EVL8_DISEL|nr:Sodium-dependent phosphate transporter 2 [Dissostichus eleginoides]
MDKREEGTERLGGREKREKEQHRVLLRQLDLFLFTVCLITCPFMELPVGGRRERDTHRHKAEVFAAEMRREEGGAE